MEQEQFAAAIQNYWDSGVLKRPTESNLSTLVPSAHDYVDQRVVNRNKEREVRSGDLSKLVRKLETLHGNLNYKRPADSWRTFYTFPEPQNAVQYASEENVHASQIVNFNEFAPEKLVSDIIDGLGIGGYRLSKIKFLTGTTGVGKTTFLKYFSKIYGKDLFQQNVVISRVKFRDIQNYKREFSVDVITAFKRTVINCLVRDICACAEFFRADAAGGVDAAEVSSEIQTSIMEALVDTLLSSDELKGWDPDRIIDELDRDEDVLLEMPEAEKCQFVLRLKDKLSFCIVLDGFDAMRPEDIALLNDDKEAEFFSCLSTVLKNGISRESTAGRCLKKINKLFLVAARPITMTQLRDEIEGETDNDQHFLPNAHVIGTSIDTLVRNRLSIHFAEELISKAKMAKFQDGVSSGIKYVMKVLREEHATIRDGRFIDLFNHNIREKVGFLADVIDLLAFKVEQKYLRDFSTVPFEALEKLEIDSFLSYINSPHSDLGIEIYEIQKLLILNKAGYYKNYFHHNTAGVLIPEAQRGQFDNIFNYENRAFFDTEHGNSKDFGKYTFAKDPLLEKLFILHRLSTEASLALTVLTRWFEDNFKYQRCRSTTLRQLMRNGIIVADYVDDVLFVSLSHKGRFVFEEFLGVSVYLEHILLNCQIPHFLSNMLIKPQDSNRRVWGRQSVSNVTLFLKYVETVASHSIKDESLGLKNEFRKLLNRIRPAVLDSFKGIISEGLEFEQLRDYSTDLERELKSAGVAI